MASKLKLQLRKELEKFHGAVRRWSRQDLTAGRWFGQFMETALASHVGGNTPPEIQELFNEAEDEDELIDDVTTAAIHRAIAVTDAYHENLTGTEIRSLKDKKQAGPPAKLTGDSVPLVAELLHVIKLYIDLMFDVAAARGKLMTVDLEAMTELIGRSLGHFDVDEAKAKGANLSEQVGAKIFSRAIIQTVGNPVADALRKGFYCYLGKALGKVVSDYAMDELDDWTPPAPETGEMLSVDPEDVGGFQT